MSIYKDLLMSQIIGGGGGPKIDIVPLTASQNGTYNAPQGSAYSPVDVDVPNTYVKSDEGKVVSDGTLISQTPHELITKNGTYDTTSNSSVSIMVTDGFDYNAMLAGTAKDVEVSAQSLRKKAFSEYTEMETFTDTNLVNIDDYAFSSCTKLKTFICGNPLTIGSSVFSQCGALKNTNIDFKSIQEIKSYVFSGCARLEGINLITAHNVGGFGLQSAGRDAANNKEFDYIPSSRASVGQSAFSQSALRRISGDFYDIGDSAFSSCRSLTDISGMNVCGYLDSGAFNNDTNVNSVDMSDWNVSTIFSSNTFSYFGRERADARTTAMLMDLRNCVFTVIPQYTFGLLVNTDIYIPDTVDTISSPAFNACENNRVYFSSSTPASLQSSSAFSGTYEVYICWKYASNYYNATNWSALSSNLFAYADSGEFVPGETLPLYDESGYSITWYSDKSKTTQITVCPQNYDMIYCVPSGQKVKTIVRFNDLGTATPSIEVKDQSTTAVDASHGFVALDSGDTIYISVSSADTNDCYIVIDGTKIDEFPYAITVSDDITVDVICWDHSVINEDFLSASWLELKNAVDAGVAQTLYANDVGKHKKLIIDGSYYSVTLVNNTTDMYEKSSSGTTGFVFMFDPSPVSQNRMNDTQTTNGGWSNSEMKTTTLPSIYDKLGSDLKAVIERVKIGSADGFHYSGDCIVVYSDEYLFLPAEKEVLESARDSYNNEMSSLKTFQFFTTDDSAKKRIRRMRGSMSKSGTVWWSRSIVKNNQYSYIGFNMNGDRSSYSANSTIATVPCFCL